jgi:AcrR family transcriptional regulator
VSPRRRGTDRSETRGALLDAAERLILEEGYAAVTSRRVVSEAGLKPPLVHYYFETMDDLFIELFRRRCERGLERHANALDSPQPLWALWELIRDEPNTTITVEFIALAHHRKALRAEIAAYNERFRQLHVDAISAAAARSGIDTERWPPIALMVLMSSVSRFLVMEESLGISAGHAETVAVVENVLVQLEGPHRPANAG